MHVPYEAARFVNTTGERVAGSGASHRSEVTWPCAKSVQR